MAISTIDQTGLNAPLTLTSPVLTTPNLGTPSAVNLSNATALPRTALPTGCILQVLQTVVTSTPSTTSNGANDFGLNVVITPTTATSKILVSANGFLGGAQTSNLVCFLQRNGSSIGSTYYDVIRVGQEGQSEYEVQPFAWQYLDSPATTSAVTYSAKFGTNNATVYLNRPYNQGGFNVTLTSTITVMEVAA
jgi:hypothetical protein